MRAAASSLLAGLVCVIVLAGCADRPPDQNGDAAAGGSAAVQRSINELVAMPGGPPGVAVVVQTGGDRRFYSGGVAHLGGRAPRITDHMRIASVAKAFSGATALVLVDRGVLGLTDTIGKWLPKLPAAWHAVTLRQLLQHTSGVPDFIRTKAFLDAYTKSPNDPPPPATLLRYAPSKLDFPPGTEYVYSNSDNIAVGLMIEAATDQPYETVLARRVLRPLGLTHTSLPRGAALPRPYIHGYVLDDKQVAPEDVSGGFASGWAWASGGIVSTPAELNTFIRGYVGGSLISADLRRAWQRLFIPDGGSEPPGPGFNSANMALFRYQTSCGTVYGHSGNTVGFTQYAVATPDGTRSATVSINLQRTQNNKGQAALVFAGLRRVVQAAICRAVQ